MNDVIWRVFWYSYHFNEILYLYIIDHVFRLERVVRVIVLRDNVVNVIEADSLESL